MTSVTMIPRDFWIHLKCLVFLNTFSAPLIHGAITWILIFTRSSHKIVFASHRTTLLISDDFIIWYPVGFLRPVLLRIELSFRGLKKITTAASSSTLPHLCFAQLKTGTTSMYSKFVSTRLLLTPWINMPH